MKIFQILHGRCHWETPFKTLDEVINRFPTDCLFVEAPDYVTEQWGFDEMEVGDDRFIAPSIPEELVMDEDTGTFVTGEELDNRVQELKNTKLAENDDQLRNYVSDHPYTYTDGKNYDYTVAAQSELRNAIEMCRTQIELGTADATVEYAAIDEQPTQWSLQDLQRLYVGVYQAYNAIKQVYQTCKTDIEACTSVEELNAIDVNARYNPQEEEEETAQTEA